VLREKFYPRNINPMPVEDPEHLIGGAKFFARLDLDQIFLFLDGHYLRVTKSGLIRIHRGAILEAAKYDGKRVLETSDDTISLEDADVSLALPADRVPCQDMLSDPEDRAHCRENLRETLAPNPPLSGNTSGDKKI
jgi:hypothetical protein